MGFNYLFFLSSLRIGQVPNFSAYDLNALKDTFLS